MNQWSHDPDTLWVFLYQPDVGYFPADQKPSPEQGRWVSLNVTFGRDRASHPEDAENVERSVILVLADGTAVNTIKRHPKQDYAAPMSGLPAGTTRLRTVRTVRVC